MKYRTLGTADGGLKVSALGLGCMPMADTGNVGYYGAADEGESLKTLHRAIELGVTLFDTAEVYGPYVNEEWLGRGIKGKRDRLVIATKFGFKIGEGAAGAIGTDGSPANARRVVEGSLQRLQIETIDLLYLHRVDRDTPIEDSVGAMAELVQAGKVRHLGLSEAGADTLRRANGVHPITALQSEYSLWERGVEDDMLPVCRELGIGFVPFSPLGRGFLTGQVKSRDDLKPGDYRLGDPRYSEENFAQNLKLVEGVERVAGRHGVSGAQVALAWLLAQGGDIVPIPGSKRRATLEDSMAAVDVTLGKDDLAELERAAPVGGTAGPRYGEAGLALTRV